MMCTQAFTLLEDCLGQDKKESNQAIVGSGRAMVVVVEQDRQAPNPPSARATSATRISGYETHINDHDHDCH